MKVLLPVDGSESSMKSVDWAVKMAQQNLVFKVTLLTVMNPFSEKSYEKNFVFDEVYYTKIYEVTRKQALEKAQEQFRSNGLEVEGVIMHGDPAFTIIQYVNNNDIDMVLMGSRGIGQSDNILGSVSYRVLIKVQVPVIIIK